MDKILNFLLSNLAYLVIAGCLILLFLSFLLFRKIYNFSKELKNKETILYRLEEELKARKSFYNKSFSILSSYENISKNIYNALLYFFEIFKVEKGIIFYQSENSDTATCINFRWDDKYCEGIKKFIYERFKDLKEGIYFNWKRYDDVKSISEELSEKKLLILPFFRKEKLIGGIFLVRDIKEKSILDTEIESFFKIIRQMVEFHLLQSEIIQRNEEANLTYKFLSEIIFSDSLNMANNKIFDFFKENFETLNFAMLSSAKDGFYIVEKGILRESVKIFNSIEDKMGKFKEGKPFYFTSGKEENSKTSFLIVPRKRSGEITGFFIFEGEEGINLRLDTINSIVRMCDMASFVTGNFKYISDKFKEKDEEIKTLKEKLEMETSLNKRFAHINTIYSISNSLKKSFIKLEGFFDLLKREMEKADYSIQIRNIDVELEEIGRELNQFNLMRVLTDENFKPVVESFEISEIYESLEKILKKFSISKKIGISIKLKYHRENVILDKNLTKISLVILIKKLLEYFESGEITIEDTKIESLISLSLSYSSSPEEIEKIKKKIEEDMFKSFEYTATKKLLPLENGKLTLDFSGNNVIKIDLFFPMEND